MSKNLSPGLTPLRLTAAAAAAAAADAAAAAAAAADAADADAADAARVRDDLATSLEHLRAALLRTPPPLRGELRKAERLLDGLWLAACVRVRLANSNTLTP